jgi:hypothetical protein
MNNVLYVYLLRILYYMQILISIISIILLGLI